MRAARGYEVKIIEKDGAITKFGGFKESVSPVKSVHLEIFHSLGWMIVLLLCVFVFLFIEA